MASSPLLESHANSTPLSDRGFHPGLSGLDLATGTAITSVQAQCFGLQVSQKHLEARLQQMSESQTQMMAQMSDMMSHMLVMSQPQTQQPQRRQGRPHPGKSMRAKKRKQAQALVEQANSSSSEGASDVDGPAAASAPAAAAAVAMPPKTAGSTPPSGTAGGALSRPRGSTDEVAVAMPVASEEATSATAVPRDDAGAASPAPPVAQLAHHSDEGWYHVAAQVESRAINYQIGTPRPEPVGDASSLEANMDLAKAVAEEVCGKLLEALKMELSAASQVAEESQTAMIAEGLQQQAERAQPDVAEAIEASKQQHAEEAAQAQQAFKEQLAAFKEEILQRHASQEALKQQHAEEATLAQQAFQEQLAAFKEEMLKQATDTRTAVTDDFASLQGQLQSDLACLRREFQEAFQKNEELHADSATRIRSMGDDVAAIKLEIAELKTHTLQLTAPTEQNTCSKQPAAPEDQDLHPPPGTGFSAAASTAGQSSAAAGQTAALSASVAPTPRTPICRVVACYSYKAIDEDWKFFNQRELVLPSSVTAPTLSDLKEAAGKVFWRGDWERSIGPGYHQLKNMDGSRSNFPSQETEERKSLQDLGCGGASFVKLHFRQEARSNGDRYWWSYEVIA